MAQFIWHSVRNDISHRAPGVKGHSLFLSWAGDRVGGRLAVKQLPFSSLSGAAHQKSIHPSTHPALSEVLGAGVAGGPSNVLWLDLAPFT